MLIVSRFRFFCPVAFFFCPNTAPTPSPPPSRKKKNRPPPPLSPPALTSLSPNGPHQNQTQKTKPNGVWVHRSLFKKILPESWLSTSGAAQRRSERRLRSLWKQRASWQRWSQPCGARAARSPTGTEEDHRGGGKAPDALWPTGTDAPASARPEPLDEPLHWFLAGLEVLCPVDGAPSLSSLADRAAEVVDSSSLRFLTASALEEEKKDLAEHEEAAAAIERPRHLFDQTGKRRKMKKRKLPRTSSHSSRDSLLRSSSTPAVAYAGLVMLAFFLALCSLLWLAEPRCLTSWPLCTRGTVTWRVWSRL